ncbi:hypothetical protein BH23ACT2_BH23ACT2_02880 [soil metagenome]
MSRPVRAVLAVLALAAVPLLGCADGGDPAEAEGALRVIDATVEVPPNPDQAAVRLVIDNDHQAADELVGVSSPAAGSVEVHRSEVDDEGRATMTQVDRLAIAPRSKVTFAPGALHVMMKGLRQPLVAGGTVELELTFAEAGPRSVEVSIVEPGGTLTNDEAEHEQHVD